MQPSVGRPTEAEILEAHRSVRRAVGAILRGSPPWEVEDIVQEIMVYVLDRDAARFDRSMGRPFRSFVGALVKPRALDARKRLRGRLVPREAESFESIVDESPSPERVAMAAQAFAALQSAELDPRQREALALALTGLTLDEVSAALAAKDEASIPSLPGFERAPRHKSQACRAASSALAIVAEFLGVGRAAPSEMPIVHFSDPRQTTLFDSMTFVGAEAAQAEAV